MFLALLAIVGNSGETAVTSIETQLFRIQCPLPIYNGVATLIDIDGVNLIYNVTYSGGNVTSSGTHFICGEDSITGSLTASTEIKEYGTTLFDFIPIGWLVYLADGITDLVDKITAIFTLLYFFFTPANFNILGFTIDDLTGIPLMVLIFVYAVCYMIIGIFGYKMLSPFVGGL